MHMQRVLIPTSWIVSVLVGVAVTAHGQYGPTPGVDYSKPNFANSPNIRKFVDSLPGLGAANTNNLGNYLPIAVADTNAYPGADYYQIGLLDYTQKMHSDLPPTKLRGYRDLAPGADGTNHYLGPVIVAQRDRPVRVKFTNLLGTGSAGALFVPVDTTIMGAGFGPSNNVELYTQNRADLHLHGGFIPWISDGTPHQWITPAGEPTSYPKGVSAQNVPDMFFDAFGNPVSAATAGATNNPGAGSQTYFWPNQQSARMMWFHDQSYGISRLNVYAGEAAGYLLTDTNEQALIASGLIPSNEVPLIIQDKAFVCDASTPATTNLAAFTAATDPLWNTALWGAGGSLWYPHVYLPNQDPTAADGTNPFGRWDWGPWFWPPMLTNSLIGPPPVVSLVPEVFVDTPVINGTAYPFLTVQPQAYRFRILNASNDRFINLQIYKADPAIYTNADGTTYTNTEVAMVPAIPHPSIAITNETPLDADDLALESPTDTLSAVTFLATNRWPAVWPTDGRDGGVPNPLLAGPAMIEIGNDGGLLPAPLIIPSTPINYEYFRRSITVLNVLTHGVYLGPAERADVIVDFSSYTNGETFILYNDASAPIPAFDPRNDYYTGDPDQSATGQNRGGAPTTLPGHGPNTRTMMQFRVAMPPLSTNVVSTTNVVLSVTNVVVSTNVAIIVNTNFSLTALTNALPAVFAATQPPPIVPEVWSGAASNTYSRIFDTALTFTVPGPQPVSSVTLLTSGSGYTAPPAVTLTGGGGSGAAAMATITRVVNGVSVTAAGSGYSTPPAVAITGGGGTGAAATSTISGSVSTLAIATPGTGYTTAPVVSFMGGGGAGATATATINAGVSAITVAAPGSGYTTTPTVTLTGGGGTGTRATATINRFVSAITVAAGGTRYTTAPTVTITGGGGAGATATATVTGGRLTAITVTAPGTGYTAAPTVTFTGGGGTGARGTVTLGGTVSAITVTAAGANYTTVPTVTITGGGGTGAQATAAISGGIATLTLTAGGAGYSSAPTVVFTGGGGAGAAATATIQGGVNFIGLSVSGSGYTTAPAVSLTGGGGVGATATATIAGAVNSVVLLGGGSGYTSAPAVGFSGGGGAGASAMASIETTIQSQPKAIQELFEPLYGRMNYTFGVELPFSSFTTQTTIPYVFIDPPTEIVPMGGQLLWKITHNGMDTHVVHFHLANVQVINRMGWDGTVKPPDPTELGWKDTVRMNPLEDIVVALQPKAPVLPFLIPDSYRPLDVTMPVGSTSGFTGVDPAGNPVTVTNPVTFFGWEYVWTCQMLSHEENDMIRPLIMVVEPFAPSGLAASVAGPGTVALTWVDNSVNETGFRIERAVNGGAFLPLNTVTSNTVAYSDATVSIGNTYSYRVIAINAYGESAPSNVATVTIALPVAPVLTAVASALSTNLPFVTLTWNNVGGLLGLTLQRATNPGFSAGLTSFPLGAAATTFTDTTVASSPTAYYYRIQAVSLIGPSLWSTPPRLVNDLGQLPATPTGLLVATTTRNSVSLSWTANLTAGPVLSYTIQRSANLTGPWTTLASVTAPTTTYTNTGLGRLTNYRYRIQAVNASGISVFTAVVTGRTL